MSKKATEFQKKEMSKMYRGKEIFKPLNTGWVDEHVACVREWVANIFFYCKGDTTIMIDAGYNYDRLEEKMGWLGHPPLFHCGGQGPDLPQSPPPTGRQSGGQALSAPVAAVAGARLVCFRQQRGAPQIPQRRPQRLPLRPLSGI